MTTIGPATAREPLFPLTKAKGTIRLLSVV